MLFGGERRFAHAILLDPLLQQADDRLGKRKIARRQQRDDALARPFEDMHFREDGDVVDAGMGACVREEDKPVF